MRRYRDAGGKARIGKAWREGHSWRQIMRMFPSGRWSVYSLNESQGGFYPPPRRRSKRSLSTLERVRAFWTASGSAKAWRQAARFARLRVTSSGHLPPIRRQGLDDWLKLRAEMDRGGPSAPADATDPGIERAASSRSSGPKARSRKRWL